MQTVTCVTLTSYIIITASRSNGEDKVELPGWGPEDWVKPGSCLAEVYGLEGHVCGGLDCVKTLEKQHKQLTVLFGNVVMKARTETELNRGESSDCTRILQHVWFSRVTIESRTET